jgi:hypothetical protein
LDAGTPPAEEPQRRQAITTCTKILQFIPIKAVIKTQVLITQQAAPSHAGQAHCTACERTGPLLVR